MASTAAAAASEAEAAGPIPPPAPSAASLASTAEPQDDLLSIIAVPKGLIQGLLGVSAAPLYAEFLGSFLLSMTYVCVDVTKDPGFYSSGMPLMLLLLMCSLASVSGGHFNPAVSLSVGLSNRGKWRVLSKYMLAQFAGGLLGVLWATAQYGIRAQGLHPRQIPLQHADYPAVSAFMVEFMFTALWCFVHLNVTLSQANNPIEEGNQFFGLALGLVLLAGNVEGQTVSGAFFNPAIAFGVTLPRFATSVWWMLLYNLAYLLAAFTAALIFRLVRGNVDVPRSNARHLSIPQLVISEGAGVFIRSYLYGMSVGSRQPTGALSSGAAIAAMSYALSDVSGAHFNPVITTTIYMNGRNESLSRSRVVVYMLTQLVFATIAALLYSLVHHAELYGKPASRQLEAPHWLRTLVGEFLFSFLLGYVVLATLVNKGVDASCSRNHYFGLAVGSVIALSGVTLHHGAGGCINPATTLAAGMAFPGYSVGPGFAWASAGVEILGGLVAAGLFPILHEGEGCDYLDGGADGAESSTKAAGADSSPSLQEAAAQSV
mmetsp:Transcript_19516/g.45405  ORF Transcript_19516/g.45405 Transcript_19516/m.45405 type:complete len:545 (-) Transcript_19516:64-1698(-)